MVETVFKTIKSELVWRTIFQTRAETATQKERPDAVKHMAERRVCCHLTRK
jgi:hypothetical protein